MKVLKFGGTSVQDAVQIKKVIDIVKSRCQDDKCIVVVSGLGGITNRLIEASRVAATGSDSYKTILLEIQTRHIDTIKQLIDIKDQSHVIANVKVMLNELDSVLFAAKTLCELSPRSLDYTMSFGERLSSYIIAQAFCNIGIQAQHADSRSFIYTDRNFNNAKVNFDLTDVAITKFFEDAPQLSIVPGFIATYDNDETTTLGRGGSDYTAAIIAAALDCEELEIWTDVDGMMTADPRSVSKAMRIPEISYSEALELSHFGAKVIYPQSLIPALAKKIPIWILNTNNPSSTGTKIHETPQTNGHYVRGISSIRNVSLITIQGSGLFGVVGIATRLFQTVAKKEVNVIMITQGSSEHSITFAVSPEDVAKAKESIELEFQLEIELNHVDPLKIENELSIIAVVGENMKNTPGISARLFSALGKNGISVIATAQGASELNISVVISNKHEKKALNAVHEAFFLSHIKTLNLFIAGIGVIGGTLLEQIKDHQETLQKENNIELRVVGLANSKKCLFVEKQIDLNNWKAEFEAHAVSMNTQAFVSKMQELDLRNSVFVDNTANKEVADLYENILSSSISVITPNKIANASTYDYYKNIRKAATRYGVQFLYETNVGAGLPIIGTLKDLRNSGDKVLKIEAILSGSLNYIFSTFSSEVSFLDAVKEARELGYTEPDPRLDLNGTDVARKILILTREIGYQFDLDDISINSCLTEMSRNASDIDELWQTIEKYDNPAMEERRIAAESKGRKLKYIATFEDGKAYTSIKEVSADHPFYNIKGSGNIISFTTTRYKANNPLVITGPGAGADVTAAGVFADILRVMA